MPAHLDAESILLELCVTTLQRMFRLRLTLYKTFGNLLFARSVQPDEKAADYGQPRAADFGTVAWSAETEDSPYLVCSDATSPRLLANFLRYGPWKIPRPDLLITVVGGARNFELQPCAAFPPCFATASSATATTAAAALLVTAQAAARPPLLQGLRRGGDRRERRGDRGGHRRGRRQARRARARRDGRQPADDRGGALFQDARREGAARGQEVRRTRRRHMLARAPEPMPPAASLASNSLRAKGPRGAPRRPRSRAPYLWGSGEEVSYTNLPAPITDEAPLNPDHTHFILVDSGKKTTWCGLARPRRASPDLPLTSGPSVARGTELQLRADLFEEAVSASTFFFMCVRRV